MSSSSSPNKPPWWAVLSSGTALVALFAGWLIGGAVQPPGYDPVRQTISVLASHGAAHRWIMTVGLYTIAVCHLVTAAGLRGAPRPARFVLACGGVAGLGLATYAQPAHGTTTGHIAFTTLGLVVLAVFPVLVGDRTRTTFPLRPRDAVAAAILSAVLVAWLVQAIHGSTLGLAERVITAQQTLWPLLVVLALRAEVRRADGRMGAWQPRGRSSCSDPLVRSAPKQ